MSGPLIVVDRSEVRAGRMRELEVAMKELVEFVDANEPRVIAYRVFFDEQGSRMTVVQVHPDAASMQLHMDLAGPRFVPLADLLTLTEMDVYGTPGDALIARLADKVRLLGTGKLRVHELHAGFARLASA